MNLDPQQTAAVEAKENNVLVIAGPGAGKTRVIVEHAAYLIEHCHTSPYEIVLVTFTRLAANEIRKRLVERVGNKAYHMTIGTFHATALELLHRFGDLIGFRKANSTVYGEFEEQYLLKEVALDMRIYNGKTWKIPKKDIDTVFATYYQEGIEPGKDNPVYDLFMAFIARMRENNSYSYGSLLTGLKLLLPHIHKYVHWKHLILDESHDTDKLQWSILEDIRYYCKTSMFVVADTDQTLYNWRGAYPQYLIEHQHEFTIYKLETNYRSVPSIVEASNRLISHNTDRIPKTMRAAREDFHGPIITVPNMDSDGLIDMIRESKTPLVVLARIHGLLEKIDRLMTEQSIPHVYIGKDTALTNSEGFRRFHAFLKLTVNNFDNFSFLLVRDLIGLSREDYSQIRIMAAEEGKSHFQVWDYYGNTGCDFFETVTFGEWDFPMVINELAKSIAWPFDIQLIKDFALAWADDHPTGTVQQYLDWLATYDIQDEIKAEEAEGITLMTIHAAKGLEFPVVIVAGCNEGILPSKQAMNNGDIEGERRLMYVAMTRAQDQCILTVRPEQTEMNGRVYESPISRFIGEAI